MNHHDILTKKIVPNNVTYIIERIEKTNTDVLHPDEQKCCVKFSRKRRLEYIAGRLCARRLLKKLGMKNYPLLTGGHGEPLWPDGIIGSISHCDEYCFVAATKSEYLIGLGIDIEPYELLSRDVVKIVCTKAERKWIKLTNMHNQSVLWSKIFFSAKESAYKCIFPHNRKFIDFQDAEIEFNPKENTFNVKANNEVEKSIFNAIFPSIKGTFFINGRYVFTSAYIPLRVPGNHQLVI